MKDFVTNKLKQIKEFLYMHAHETKVVLYATGLLLLVFLFSHLPGCSNATIHNDDVKLDLSALSDENPARCEQAVENADYAVVKITSIRGEDDTFTIDAEFPGYPDVKCNVYLSTDDIVKINVGDTVTVKGHIKYYQRANSGHYIVIGDAIGLWPFITEAQLVEVEKGGNRL